jgi:hypothetical protein
MKKQAKYKNETLCEILFSISCPYYRYWVFFARTMIYLIKGFSGSFCLNHAGAGLQRL